MEKWVRVKEIDIPGGEAVFLAVASNDTDAMSDSIKPAWGIVPDGDKRIEIWFDREPDPVLVINTNRKTGNALYKQLAALVYHEDLNDWLDAIKAAAIQRGDWSYNISYYTTIK